ncbi:hypothetical protein GF373_11795, partial [bacterium]|nr:hypothetical protein [bacterium]
GREQGFNQISTYTIFGNGEILVDTNIDPVGDLPPLPRLGMNMTIPGQYNTFTWFGRGPHENYCDRNTSAPVGRYQGSVDDQFVPYIKPQENGNKTDVRWVALTDEEGYGLLAIGQPTFETSAHHYTARDMADARHPVDLHYHDNIFLNLDYKQMGVGGDDSWTPLTVHPPYRVMPEHIQFRFRLVPFHLTEDWPEACNYRLPVADPPTGKKKLGMNDRKGEIKLESLSRDAVIRYTVDGSQPSEDSPVYNKPIQLTKNAVVKAAAFSPSLLPSAPLAIAYNVFNISFDTCVMRAGYKAKRVDIDVSGAKELRLLGEDVDLLHWDYIAWGDAKLIDREGKEIPLSSLKPTYCEQAMGELQINRSLVGDPLTIAGKQFRQGLGTHAPFDIRYALDGKYKTFQAWVGLDTQCHKWVCGGDDIRLFNEFGKARCKVVLVP